MVVLPEQYTLPIEIASYDVGPDNRLRISGVLRYQQEVAERHIAPAGMGWNALMEQGMAFVASRFHCRINRLPEMGERVTLTTWHRVRKGPRFFRCYEWRDAGGALLLCGVMQLALVSTADHRLLRGDEFERLGGVPSCAQRVDCDDPERLKLPALVAARDYTVGWSDTDRNAHMNNTRYADLACDALAVQLQGNCITDVQMHFAGETRREDTVSLSVGLTDAAYVQGCTERGVAFTARFELEKDNGV